MNLIIMTKKERRKQRAEINNNKHSLLNVLFEKFTKQEQVSKLIKAIQDRTIGMVSMGAIGNQDVNVIVVEIKGEDDLLIHYRESDTALMQSDMRIIWQAKAEYREVVKHGAINSNIDHLLKKLYEKGIEQAHVTIIKAQEITGVNHLCPIIELHGTDESTSEGFKSKDGVLKIWTIVFYDLKNICKYRIVSTSASKELMHSLSLNIEDNENLDRLVCFYNAYRGYK